MTPSSTTSSPKSSSTTSLESEDDAGAFDPDANHPWTHRPYCPEDGIPYCVHTSSSFRDDGVSFITIPFDRAMKTGEKTSIRFVEVLLAAEALAQKEKTTAFSELAVEPKDKPYEVKDLSGKGKGVIATAHIPRGSVLMVEHAAVIADTLFPSKVKRVVGREMLQRAMTRLGKDGEKAISELARSSREQDQVPAAEDLMRTNSFTVKIADKSHMALFPRVARINHACQPSAITRFDEKTLSMTVRAMKDIEPGEEITLSCKSPLNIDTDFGLSYHERQTTLKSKWGFDCTCSLCSATPSEIAASDARRDKIAKLGKVVIKHVENQDLKAAIKMHREMIDIIEDEALAPHMGDYYEIMTRFLAATNDMKNAKKYARLALEEFKAAGETKDELEQFLKAAK
ncbi:hypothetical protein B0T16DRAFT_331319 [Cercophora newfieldiana]|uniref:SET domain-containing protein n=1 Tax=Cercophora newfieldiana TaxID=92897 RepID=A0AA39XYY1_9PEZI|nr:hypothetical protein B0T16DRAFT_331319 [Cercophora newfieldiana]